MAGSVCFNKRIYVNTPKEEVDAEMKRRREMLPIRVVTGLGSDVDRYVSQSKTLVKQILQLRHNDWKIMWGPANQGSKVQRAGSFFGSNKIIIDSKSKTGRSYDIAYLTSALAHEVGHAIEKPGKDFSSFKACMDNYMIGPGSEANAVLNQLLVHAEILEAACIDIFEEGQEYEFMKKDFVNFYNQGIRIGDMTNVRRQIADRYSKQYISLTDSKSKSKSKSKTHKT